MRNMLLLSAGLVLATYAGAQEPFRGRVGEPLPAVSLETLAGEAIDPTSLKGEVSLVNLWATWCLPCRAEMPHLTALAEKFAGQGLRVVGVSLDHPRQRAKVETFVSEHRLGYEIWVDPSAEAMDAFGATSLPVNLLFDRSGTVAWSRVGPLLEGDPELERSIASALGEAAPESGP